MAEYSLLQQQRIEAKAAMLRIFRFKARRGVGVFYSLVSLLLLGAFLLFGRSYSPFLVLAGVFVAATAVWYVAEAAGFRGFDRMTYSLEFLEGGEELVRERRRWFTNPHLLRLITFSWGAAFIAAEALGLSSVALVVLTVWMTQSVLLKVFSLSRTKNGILERRPEDWAVIAVFPLAFLSFVVAGTPVWGLLFAVPIYLLAGLKSLYDAPKELIRVGA
jgi:hypothetical protein